MNGIIEIVELLEKSSVLIDGANKTVTNQIKKQKGGFLGVIMAPMAASLIVPNVFSLI